MCFSRKGWQDSLKKTEEKQLNSHCVSYERNMPTRSLSGDKVGRIKENIKSLALKQNIEYVILTHSGNLRKLISLLKDLEMRQVEQCEELTGEFETKYFEVKQSCLEGQQAL